MCGPRHRWNHCWDVILRRFRAGRIGRAEVLRLLGGLRHQEQSPGRKGHPDTARRQFPSLRPLCPGGGRAHPPEVFAPAFALLDEAASACEGNPDPAFAARVAFLREGIVHSQRCVEAAMVMNDPGATVEQRGQALTKLVAYRRSVEHLGIASMDRAAGIETDSWKDVAGFKEAWTTPAADAGSDCALGFNSEMFPRQMNTDRHR